MSSAGSSCSLSLQGITKDCPLQLGGSEELPLSMTGGSLHLVGVLSPETSQMQQQRFVPEGDLAVGSQQRCSRGQELQQR